MTGSFSRGGAPSFANSRRSYSWAVHGTLNGKRRSWRMPCRTRGLLPWLWGGWRIISMPVRRLRRPCDVTKGFALFQVLLWGHDLNGEILSPGILLLLGPGVVALPLLHLSPLFLHMSQGISVRAPPLGAASHVSPPVLPSHIPDTLATSQALSALFY